MNLYICNKKMSSKNGIGVIKSGNEFITDPRIQATLFNEFFAEKFVVDNGFIPDVVNKIDSGVGINYVPFPYISILKKLEKLKADKAGGPDCLSPNLLRRIAQFIAHQLSWLFETSFLSNYIPPVWKLAHVTPVFKKGKSSDLGNYRPIALTCTLCKIMESCIKDELMKYLLDHSLITRHQHGFISRRSTCTQLLECIQDWQFELTNKITTDVLYIDFARAFDSVVHSKLLVKLESYGIGYELLNWFRNFLTGRSQMVAIDGHLSTSVNVMSGVPQGSVIGPILFILFVNDIVDILPDSVTCKLFADDIKLYSSVDVSLPINSLHVSLDLIVEWANIWQLPINSSKCSVLHLGSKFVQSNADYFIKNQTIVSLSEVRDLGILLDDGLRFNRHISQIITKAYQRIAVIFRGFYTRNVTFLIRAYKTYIRPILEYCTQIWNPYLIGEITAIEKVQKYFTKRLSGMKSLNYNDRLQRLNLESLELRRLKADLVMYFKIDHGAVDLNVDDFFKRSPIDNTQYKVKWVQIVETLF